MSTCQNYVIIKINIYIKNVSFGSMRKSDCVSHEGVKYIRSKQHNYVIRKTMKIKKMIMSNIYKHDKRMRL